MAVILLFFFIGFVTGLISSAVMRPWAVRLIGCMLLWSPVAALIILRYLALLPASEHAPTHVPVAYRGGQPSRGRPHPTSPVQLAHSAANARLVGLAIRIPLGPQSDP